MPRRLIKRFLPDHDRIRNHKHLRRFGARLHDPNLWHLNRRSVAGSTAVGLFCALLPVPFQMVLAAGGAIVFRVNLPVSVVLVWVTNPLTIPPVFYSTYRLGTWLLGVTPIAVHGKWSLDWLGREMWHIWEPLLLGSVVAGLLAALLGWASVRLLWRCYVLRMRRRRQRRRPLTATSASRN